MVKSVRKEYKKSAELGNPHLAAVYSSELKLPWLQPTIQVSYRYNFDVTNGKQIPKYGKQ
jgi:hypothetical protein